MYKVLAICSLMIGAQAQYGDEGHGHEEHKVVDYYAPPHYKYEYSVHDSHTHDIKKQEEERKDDKVKGFYSLHEADGTVREVHYTSDKHNGFNAVVHRSGHAKHPQKYGSSGEKYYGHHLEEHHEEEGHHGGEGGHHGEESGGAESSSSFFGHY